MNKEEVEKRVLQIARECDADYGAILSEQLIRQMRSGVEAFSLELTDQKKREVDQVFKEGRDQISRLLASLLSQDDVCDIAAKYILSNTVNKRLSDARGEKAQSDLLEKKRLRLRIEDSQGRADFLRGKIAQIPAQTRSEQAKRGGIAKYSTARKARTFVQSEWEKYRDEYQGNKSEFARVYVRRLLNEFQTASGDPFVVTVKQVRDVWLSDSRLAGKPTR